MSSHKPAIMALLLTLAATTAGCCIPLPEETAIVVEVFDARGGPVNGVSFILDGSDTVITGTQFSYGQVFKSLSVAGPHDLQMEMDSLTDPQGGTGWVPLASQLSGELVPRPFGKRPFAGGSDILDVPVNKGEITVVSIYLDDLLKSPADNQWLTDGSNPSGFRAGNDTDEFRDSPEPVFWWRQDPSMGVTVDFTVQLWEDDDTDTRYPLGIADHVQYGAAMNPANAAYQAPDWQVPLAGIQRAESASTVNQVVLWASQAFDGAGTPATAYDLYYAPASHWNGSDLESNPVLRDLSYSIDGSAARFQVGIGTLNDGLVLKNGVPYTFALAARDEASNLDTVTAGTPRGERMAAPREEGNTLGSVSGLVVTDNPDGGTLTVAFNCAPSDSLRIYAAPSGAFNTRPFDPRFVREEISCPGSSPHDIEY
ncbi:MAG: hypothetical protein RRA32_05190, partial [bacterium]|nr:hypothetical protein [bacterium]